MENIITIEDKISAALDSYSVIENLRSKKTLSEEDSLTIERNIEHLRIMLNNQEFIDNISEIDLEKINKYL